MSQYRSSDREYKEGVWHQHMLSPSRDRDELTASFSSLAELTLSVVSKLQRLLEDERLARRQV
jgi:hypothetical protein